MAEVNKQLKTARAAYAEVNGISVATASKGRHDKRVKGALEEVAGYSGYFPGEDEDARSRRLDMEGPANGEITELAQHFKDVNPTLYGDMSSWHIIFTAQNQMATKDAVDQEDANEEVAYTGDKVDSKTTESRMTEDNKSSSDTENNKIKEVTQMGNVLEQEEMKMEKSGEDLLGKGKKPEGGSSAASAQAAMNHFKESSARRMEVSRETSCSKIVLARPSASKVFVLDDAGKAYGTLVNVQKAIGDFREKTGMVENPEDGTVTFPNVPVEFTKEAKLMWEELKAAQEDPTKLFEVNIGKGNGSVKGFRYVGKDQKEDIKSISEMITFIIEDAWGVINVSKDDGVQLRVKKARTSTTSTEGKGSGTGKSKDKNPYKGLATICITSREIATEKFSETHKVIDTSKPAEKQKGARSKLAVKFFKNGELNSDGKRKVNTWRLPLMAEQYHLVVTDPDLLKKFGDGVSASKSVAAINTDDATALEGLGPEFQDLFGEVMSSGVLNGTSELVKKVVEEANEIDAKAKEAQAKEIEEGVEV